MNDHDQQIEDDPAGRVIHTIPREPVDHSSKSAPTQGGLKREK